jgi:hypothetical protein
MWALSVSIVSYLRQMNPRLVGSDVTGTQGVDSDRVRSPLDSELLDDGRSSGLGRVVEDLVDSLVDNLGRHGRGEDDGSLLVARLGPKVGGSLSTGELTPNIDVVYKSARFMWRQSLDGYATK